MGEEEQEGLHTLHRRSSQVWVWVRVWVRVKAEGVGVVENVGV
jgi:hypothetical protein